MKYKIRMHHSYHVIEFVFDDYEEMCVFMNQALAHAEENVEFSVCIVEEKEGEEDETI